MNYKSNKDIDLINYRGRKYHPSPKAWEDQVLYFLLVDRFSDGKEKGYRDLTGKITDSGFTPPFKIDMQNNASPQWEQNGVEWRGGNIKGLTSKIGYLKRLGITAIWISPVFKQVDYSKETYHGYGIQNFLEIDPHFGTRDELRNLVNVAHENSIYIILDIIFNHAGDVFRYNDDDPYWTGQKRSVKAFLDSGGEPTIQFKENINNSINDAVWPVELQKANVFTCKGYIKNWDYDPEYYEGDFYSLKDINLGSFIDSSNFQPSDALTVLVSAYKYWIAELDIDGYRIDTVKHMPAESVRYFVSCIREYTQTLGKENFFMVGEITGGRTLAYDKVEKTGLNAALGIDDVQDKLEYLVKGYRNPSEYFDLFRNSILLNKDSHLWFRDKVVTMLDDHDQVRRGNDKARFCSRDNGEKLVLAALALNVLTLGIPCIYYGTEQYFDGNGNSDRFLRECMFGGGFGAFHSENAHFFNEDNLLIPELSKILAIRRKHLPLMRGRQYLRQISGNCIDFGYPHIMGQRMDSIVAWSRIFDREEILIGINTDVQNTRKAWVTIDGEINHPDNNYKCVYSTKASQTGSLTKVISANGCALHVEIPPAGAVIFVPE
jgi:glycosidase